MKNYQNYKNIVWRIYILKKDENVIVLLQISPYNKINDIIRQISTISNEYNL